MEHRSARPRVNITRSMSPRAMTRDHAAVARMWWRMYDRGVKLAVSAAPEATDILDAVAGPGYVLPRLLRAYPDATLTAMDVSPDMIARARGTLDRQGLEGTVRLVEGSPYEMPFPDASFDLVLATQAIHMFDDLPAFLAEAGRVLSPGGKLVVLDFRRDCPFWMRWMCWVSTNIVRVSRLKLRGFGAVIDACYTSDELESMVAAAGFVGHDVRCGLIELSVVAER